MKGSAQIISSPRKTQMRLSTVSRNAWPFEIIKGRGTGKIAFIFNDRGRKQICYLDTLCREDVNWALERGDPTVRMLEAGETIELAVDK